MALLSSREGCAFWHPSAQTLRLQNSNFQSCEVQNSTLNKSHIPRSKNSKFHHCKVLNFTFLEFEVNNFCDRFYFKFSIHDTVVRLASINEGTRIIR